MTARFSLFVPILLFSSALISFAQTVETKSVDDGTADRQPSVVDSRPAPSDDAKPKANFLKDVARDQKTIFSSPFRIKKADLKWLVPLAATTTALLLTDRSTSSWIGRKGMLSYASHGTSYAGSIYATAGFAAGLYFIGKGADMPRLQKTGRLAFEALVGTSAVLAALKCSMGRMRPNSSDPGHFFEGGRSFPSGHSSSAWSVATVVAYQYKDRPLIKYGAIVAAIAISMSRYTGRAHFLSEVVAGSAIGFGIGRFVAVSHR